MKLKILFLKIFSRLKTSVKIFLEFYLIIMWALWIGRAYLNLSPDMWPSNGQEYIMSIQNEYNWNMLTKCGTCFFWNGFTNGGAPSFIDVHGGWLHPISIAATFLVGVFNSGKIIVVASLLMAGLAQWWLGKLFKLNWMTRMWTSMLMIACGGLAGRMQIGNVPLVLSTAACILVLPAALQLLMRGGIKNAILLGITFGLAIISGQGYLQIGLMICLIPLILFFLVERAPQGLIQLKSDWRYFLLALILGCLIAAPLLVPFGHISSIFGKDLDPAFGSSQPLKYNLLNLVVDDPGFFLAPTLGKAAFPYLYINYIGWLPVLLAIWGMVYAPQQFRKYVIGFCIAISLVYLCSSAELFKWLDILPIGELFAGIRNPGPIQSLAVPFILVLAGFGGEDLLKREWPKLSLATLQQNQNLGIIDTGAIKWAVILLFMLFNLKAASDFSNEWLYMLPMAMDTQKLMEPLKTVEAQWVQPPWGEYLWLPGAFENGIKIRSYFRPWRLDTPEMPPAYLQMSNFKEDANLPEFEKNWGDYVILRRPDSLYAYITDGETKLACQAKAQGGNVDVHCNSPKSGILIVMERSLSGWNVWSDGKRTNLVGGTWLSVQTDPGQHNYSFRYQPWDAPLGIVLAVLAWIGSIAGMIILPLKKKEIVQVASPTAE